MARRHARAGGGVEMPVRCSGGAHGMDGWMDGWTTNDEREDRVPSVFFFCFFYERWGP